MPDPKLVQTILKTAYYTATCPTNRRVLCRDAVPTIFNFPSHSSVHVTRYITTPSAVEDASIMTEPKWQLVASACISRPPVIAPLLSPIEQQYKKLLTDIEAEKSLKSDHELRMIEDQVRAELISVGKVEDINLDEAAKQTASEFEDACEEELQAFKFSPRLTEADENSNLSSLNRALDRALVLTIKQKLGSQYHRVLPQMPWSPGETLRQTCDRVIKNVCGSKVKVKVLGNSPCGFFKYKYPKEVRKEGFIGAKVFFFMGHVIAYDLEGLNDNEEFKEHQWLTHDELAHSLNNSYYQAVFKFLISDK